MHGNSSLTGSRFKNMEFWMILCGFPICMFSIVNAAHTETENSSHVCRVFSLTVKYKFGY